MNEERVREGFPGQRLTVVPVEVVRRCRTLPVVQDLFVTDVGHFPSAAHHYVERPEGTSGTIFIYCTSGAGWCKMEGQQWDVKEGYALFIPAGTPHTYGADPTVPWSICWAHVDGARVSDFLEVLEVSGEAPLLYVPDTRLIVQAFEEVYSHVHQGYSNSSLFGLSTALARLLGLLETQQRPPHTRGRRREEKILQSIQFMRDHLEEPCRLEELAEAAQLSTSHYSYLFKEQTNASPITFFIRLKMQRACELLDTTGQTVAFVAEQVGYQDPFHFSRMFKKVIGRSPSQYRDMVKG